MGDIKRLCPLEKTNDGVLITRFAIFWSGAARPPLEAGCQRHLIVRWALHPPPKGVGLELLNVILPFGKSHWKFRGSPEPGLGHHSLRVHGIKTTLRKNRIPKIRKSSDCLKKKNTAFRFSLCKSNYFFSLRFRIPGELTELHFIPSRDGPHLFKRAVGDSKGGGSITKCQMYLRCPLLNISILRQRFR